MYRTERQRLSGICARRGSTLVLALIFSLVLGIIIAASLSRTVYTWLTTQRSYRFNQALQVAECGIERVLNEMNTNLALDYDNTVTDGTVVDAWNVQIGEYSVRVDPNPMTPSIKVLTSRAAVPLLASQRRIKVERTVRVAVRRTQFPVDLYKYAIYTPKFISTNGITEIHGNTKSGELISSTGNLEPHLRVTQYPYQYWDEETESVETAFGQVYEGYNMDDDPTNDVVLPWDEYILEYLKNISINQGYFFESEPREDQLPRGYFQPDGVTPNVVFITSDIHLAGNYQFGGLIVVVGNIITEEASATFGGSHQVDGIVYSTGGFRTHGGGNRTINIDGGVFCGSATLQGHTRVQYNWVYMDALKNLVNASNKFRFSSWREVMASEETSS